MDLLVILITTTSILFVIVVGLIQRIISLDKRQGPGQSGCRTENTARLKLGRPAFFLTPQRAVVMGTSSLLTAAFLGMAVNRDSHLLQMAELEGYARAVGSPRVVAQVDLRGYRSFSQYAPAVTDPQAGNFGSNACGLIAPAQAVLVAENPTLAGTQPGFRAVIALMSQIRAKAVLPGGALAYQGSTGIQPSALVKAVRASPVGTGWSVAAQNQWTLAELYQALLDEKIVIVDIRVQQDTEIPSTRPENFAHYARVLGIDLNRQVVFLENTLDQKGGKSYWTLPLESFMKVWEYPETQVSLRPSQQDPAIREENVNRWAMVLSRR